jgi:hypothetical protein
MSVFVDIIPDDDSPIVARRAHASSRNIVYDEVCTNLIALLKKKSACMRISAKCHKYLALRFASHAWYLNAATVLLLGASFILTTSYTGLGSTQINIPLVITTGLSMMMKGFIDYTKFLERSVSHEKCWVAAINLSDDMEFILLRNNHTKKSLQQHVDANEEQIKNFRKQEELIPLDIKEHFIKDLSDDV